MYVRAGWDAGLTRLDYSIYWHMQNTGLGCVWWGLLRVTLTRLCHSLVYMKTGPVVDLGWARP